MTGSGGPTLTPHTESWSANTRNRVTVTRAPTEPPKFNNKQIKPASGRKHEVFCTTHGAKFS